MDSLPTPSRPVPIVTAEAAPLTAHARLERLSEPWSLNRSFAVLVTMILAMVLGSWAASGQIADIILLCVWFGAVTVIIFVQDYWWSPLLIITALAFQTAALGFPMTGMEIGVLILAITFPVKIAMKSLRKAEPEMRPGTAYWALLGFLLIHFIVILFYSKIEGVPLKNIVKAYYTAIVPLLFVGLLMRYCQTRTVRPTLNILFFTNLFVVCASMVTLLRGVVVDPFSDLSISVGWLDGQGAINILRGSGPFLFVGCLAFRPAVRPGLGKLVLDFALVMATMGTLLSGGRLSLATCVAGGIFFAVVRRRVWLAIPFLVVTAVISAVITAMPGMLYNLPESIQRAVGPLNFSDQQTEIQETLEGSNDWHQALRDRSADYWKSDTNSFWLGHGYKSYDYSLDEGPALDAIGTDYKAEIAVEMGLTENMFSSITNIFGLVGLVFYVWFFGYVAWMLYKACRVCPPGSDARALCEFSLVSILASLLFCFYMGSVPGLNLIYWTLGLLAARPYIAKAESAAAKTAPELPAFARPLLSGKSAALAPHRFRPGRA